MTDEKQIEEMLKIMCEEHGVMCGECEMGLNCANELHAQRLYKAGYRKIPENAVVLTKEMYELYEHHKNNYEVGKRDGSKETAREIFLAVKDLIVRCEYEGVGIYDLIKLAKQYGVEVE